MQPIDPNTDFKALQTVAKPISEATPRLSPTYGAKVAELLMRLYAGNPIRPSDSEFKLKVADWTQTLQDIVPEHRLLETFTYARRNRDSNYLLDVSEICAAWNRMRETERHILPPAFQYDYRGTEVCPECHNTGTKLVVKRDPVLQRDYTYGLVCHHEGY